MNSLTKKSVKYLLAAVLLGLSLWAYQNKIRRVEESDKDNRPLLVVFSYSNFNSLLGPGRDLKEIFEKNCHCNLRIINGGEPNLMLSKIKYLEEVDIVIGLDQFLLDRARLELDWKSIEFTNKYSFYPALENYKTKDFVPFDWSPVTILYWNSLVGNQFNGKENFASLLEIGLSKVISIQSPRTSSLGSIFMWWSSQELATESHKRKFFDLIHSVSPTWDTSYGMFQKKLSPATVSYLSSLTYHRKYENDFDVRAFVSKNGLPVQVEYFGILESCRQCELAREFAEFLLKPEAQKIFFEKNYMFPVSSDVFASVIKSVELPKFNVMSPPDQKEYLRRHKVYLREWEKNLSL